MPNFITPEELDKHFEEVHPTEQPAGAPPEPNPNPYLTGSISPVLQHDPAYVATGYKRGSGVPTFPLMPVQNSGNQAQDNSGATTVSKNLIKPVQTQVSQNTAAIAALQETVFQGAWSATTSYSIGATVDFGGIIYTSLQANNLNNQPNTSPTFWSATGVSEFLGNWSAVTNYVPGDQTIDLAGGGGYYIATAPSLNKQPSLFPADWQLITPGNVNAYEGNYSGATAYTPGEIVSYLGSQWVCISATTGNAPSTTSSFWTLIGTNALFTGNWNSGTAYTANMIAVQSGNEYQCILANTNQQPPNATYWQLLGPATLDNLVDGGVYLKTPVYSGTSVNFQNGNFEASSSLVNGAPPGWGTYSGNETLSYDTSTPYAGTQSLIVTTNGGGVGYAKSPAKLYAAQAGDIFYATAYGKRNSGSSTISMQIAFRSATGSFTGGVTTTTTSGSFVQVTVNSGVAGAGTAYVEVYVGNDGASTVSEWDSVTLVRLTTLGPEVQDGPSNFSATASGLVYRPLSNPLSGHDAGASATINIASFTMRTSSKGDISVNSGSVTALSYNTLYYIYYDDATLAGGAVSYFATTTRGTAINGTGRFFVGSVVTPLAGAADTVGNNDGGSGTLSSSVITQVFTSGGTWTKPDGALFVQVTLVAGGGGGGAGGSSGSGTHGGGGGGGGGMSQQTIPAINIPSTVTVTVGAGGTGGAGVGNADGNPGISGGDTSFGSFLRATGGARGFGGTSVSGGTAGAAGTVGNFGLGSPGGAGGSSGGGANATDVVGTSLGAGGGGGGSSNPANTGGNGGAGSPPRGTPLTGGTGSSANSSATGGTGSSGIVGEPVGGGGGGGGSLTNLGAPGRGGNGGNYGAGGGGGGTAVTVAGGAGGNGAPGLCVVTTYF